MKLVIRVQDKMETFTELIQHSRGQDKETEAKVKGKHFIIPAGKIAQINCKINLGFIEKQKARVLQQRDVELPVGIQYADSVVPAITQRPGNVP